MHEIQRIWGAHQIVPDAKLNQLIAKWDKCLTNAQPSFKVYKKQDELAAAELGLKFLGLCYQDLLKQTADALMNTNVKRNKFKESPDVKEDSVPNAEDASVPIAKDAMFPLPKMPVFPVPKMPVFPMPKMPVFPMPKMTITVNLKILPGHLRLMKILPGHLKLV